MADGDQALAAEPGFHGDPPQCGGCGLTTVRRLSGHYSEVVEQQPENGLALAAGPAQALRGIMEDGAGAAAFARLWLVAATAALWQRQIRTLPSIRLGKPVA